MSITVDRKFRQRRKIILKSAYRNALKMIRARRNLPTIQTALALSPFAQYLGTAEGLMPETTRTITIPKEDVVEAVMILNYVEFDELIHPTPVVLATLSSDEVNARIVISNERNSDGMLWEANVGEEEIAVEDFIEDYEKLSLDWGSGTWWEGSGPEGEWTGIDTEVLQDFIKLNLADEITIDGQVYKVIYT